MKLLHRTGKRGYSFTNVLKSESFDLYGIRGWRVKSLEAKPWKEHLLLGLCSQWEIYIIRADVLLSNSGQEIEQVTNVRVIKKMYYKNPASKR